jgi:hypothetical protein
MHLLFLESRLLISPGAFWLCCGCAETYYCNRACEKNSWKHGDHKEKCAELQATQKAALLGKHGPDPVLTSGDGAAAAASGREGAAAPPPISAEEEKSEDVDPVHPCLICLEDDDDAIVVGAVGGMLLQRW